MRCIKFAPSIAARDLANQLQDGPLEYLIERAIDEARSRYFMPPPSRLIDSCPHSLLATREAY
jgi:hypothetical protein